MGVRPLPSPGPAGGIGTQGHIWAQTCPAGGAPRGDPCPLLPLPGGRGWMGCRQQGHLLAVLGKVNGYPAAVGAMDVSSAGDCAVAAAVSWRRSPGLLGLALLWRNSSVPPGTLPATACHRHHRCGKVFIQQFPRELGTWGECARSSGCGGWVAVAQVPGARCLVGRDSWQHGRTEPRLPTAHRPPESAARVPRARGREAWRGQARGLCPACLAPKPWRCGLLG